MGLEVSPPGTSSRPADVLLHGLDSMSPLAVDFSVVHPLQVSQNLAEVYPGKSAKAAGRKKTREPFAVCHKAGWQFCPFIVETQGTWGGQARHIMQRIFCLWALKIGCSKSEAAVSCTGSISTAGLSGGVAHSQGIPQGFSTACNRFLVACHPQGVPHHNDRACASRFHFSTLVYTTTV